MNIRAKDTNIRVNSTEFTAFIFQKFTFVSEGAKGAYAVHGRWFPNTRHKYKSRFNRTYCFYLRAVASEHTRQTSKNYDPAHVCAGSLYFCAAYCRRYLWVWVMRSPSRPSRFSEASHPAYSSVVIEYFFRTKARDTSPPLTNATTVAFRRGVQHTSASGKSSAVTAIPLGPATDLRTVVPDMNTSSYCPTAVSIRVSIHLSI